MTSGNNDVLDMNEFMVTIGDGHKFKEPHFKCYNCGLIVEKYIVNMYYIPGEKYTCEEYKIKQLIK